MSLLHGVSGNYRAVASYLHHAARRLFKWLNRRNQRRSLNWKRCNDVIRFHLSITSASLDASPFARV
jgi:hypothetical protein